MVGETFLGADHRLRHRPRGIAVTLEVVVLSRRLPADLLVLAVDLVGHDLPPLWWAAGAALGSPRAHHTPVLSTPVAGSGSFGLPLLGARSPRKSVPCAPNFRSRSLRVYALLQR